MKNLAEGKNARGAMKSTSKVLAWALSVMLIVTGITPTLAAENKAPKQGDEKVVVSDSTLKKLEDSVKEMNRKAKPVVPEDKNHENEKKKANNKAKVQKNDKNAKAGKVKNKRGATCNLNETGNVKAVVDADKNITVTATDTSGDMKIERDKWIDMVVALGGTCNPDPEIGLSWKGDEKSIDFQTNGIQLPDNCHTFFRGFKGLISGCEKLNTSDVTDMYGMFSFADVVDLNVSNWDTSNVTNMAYMFNLTEKANPNVSNWNTSNVTNMACMFNLTEKANPNVSKWNTSNVTNMGSMFYGAVNANPDVSNWNTSKVENMESMFYCAERANPDVSKWNTSNVTNMKHMFYGAVDANPDVSNWDTSKVTNMECMFRDTKKANPDVSKWYMSAVTDMEGMFRGSGIKKADLSKWKLHSDVLNNLENARSMFDACYNLETLKTPVGLETSISRANSDFKIVKLKEGSPVFIEKESQNLYDAYIINQSGDKEAVYHIYRKDKYAGVTFDKNGGDTECWFNHEIVEKGKTFLEGGGDFPDEYPIRAGYKFYGWTINKDDLSSSFSNNTVINNDMTVYTAWLKPHKDKAVTVRVVDKGIVSLEFSKAVAAVQYGVTITPSEGAVPYTQWIMDKDVKTLKNGKKVIKIKGLKMNEFIKFGLEAFGDDHTKVAEYNTGYAFTLGLPKLKTKVKKVRKGRKKIKVHVLTLRFRPSKVASGYVATLIVRGKVKKIKLKKGKKKLRKFLVGSIRLPKRGKCFLTLSGFKKIKGKKYYGMMLKKRVK